MQKRTFISGIPYWVGVYDEGPREWHAIGEVRGHMILTVGLSERLALECWAAEAEGLLSRLSEPGRA